jgi:hypothetical protein
LKDRRPVSGKLEKGIIGSKASVEHLFLEVSKLGQVVGIEEPEHDVDGNLRVIRLES